MNGIGQLGARPELMAIGDSCYNGVRSLTINASLAALSVPAQVAKAFGWSFAVPDYPRQVLFDFEQIMRRPALFPQLRQMIIDNVHAWLADPKWSTQVAFDNIAIAQATISDLTHFTYGEHIGKIAVLLDQVAGNSALKIDALMDLHLAVNGCFLLNPANDSGLSVANLTPVDIVALRRPRRLLVNIGINDGIWTVCLEARTDRLDRDKIFADMMALGQKLFGLRQAGAVDRIYFNLLPKPSVVANLMPPRNPQACPADPLGYYPHYVGRLGMQGGLSDQQLGTVDTTIARLNDDIRTGLSGLFGAMGGITFVDIFATMAAQDAKHCREPSPIRVNHGRSQWHLTNNALQGLAILGGFTGGGLFGLDNLHPTAVGYAVLATAVCRTIAATEGIPVPYPINFQDAFDADSLLQDLPGALDFEDFLLDLAIAFVS